MKHLSLMRKCHFLFLCLARATRKITGLEFGFLSLLEPRFLKHGLRPISELWGSYWWTKKRSKIRTSFFFFFLAFLSGWLTISQALVFIYHLRFCTDRQLNKLVMSTKFVNWHLHITPVYWWFKFIWLKLSSGKELKF